MSNVQEIRERIHSANGALSVIGAFIRRVDAASLTDEDRKLHQAALRSLDRAKDDLISIQDAALLLDV